MSIKNRQLVAAFGSAAAVVYTVPFAIAAVAGVLRVPRMSAAMLFGTACGAFAIEAWTAYVNRQGCAAFSEFASVIDSFPASCSPIGLALLLVAAIASVIAAILLVGSTRVGRGVMFVLAGIVLAPLLLYLLSIATFALRAA